GCCCSQADAIAPVAECQRSRSISPDLIALEQVVRGGSERLHAVAEVAGNDIPLAGAGAADGGRGCRIQQYPVLLISQCMQTIGRRADQVPRDQVCRRVLRRADQLDAGSQVAGNQIGRTGRRPADGVRSRADDVDALTIGLGDGSARVCSHLVALYQVAAAAAQDDARGRETGDYQALDNALSARENKAVAARPGAGAIDLDQRRTCVLPLARGLARAIDQNGIGDLWQRTEQRDALDARARNIEVDRAGAGIPIDLIDSPAKRTRTAVVGRILNEVSGQQESWFHELDAGPSVPAASP